MSKHKTRGHAETPELDDRAFDAALIGGAFDMAEASGWERVSVAGAARRAGLALDRARGRFPGRGAILLRFGSLADQAAVAAAGTGMAPREVLFDVLMARFDMLQQHRGGVLALLRALVLRPGASLLLASATRGSMRWMLEAAAIPTEGLVGRLRVDGLTAAWFYVLRAWTRDDSPDLTATMAALDRALSRAMQAEEMIGRGSGGVDGVMDVDDDDGLPPGMVQDVPAEPSPVLPPPPPDVPPPSSPAA